VHEGFRRLEQAGAKGSVLLYDPAFYSHFVLSRVRALRYGEAAAEHSMVLLLRCESITEGRAEFHGSFSVP
jgi:predicted N-acetyltransferase YhbS